MGKHRCAGLIQNALDKGNNFIILHGNGIDDNFLYDFFNGVHTSTDNYKLLFLCRLGYSYVIHINDAGVPMVFAPDENDSFHDVTDVYFDAGEMELDDDDPTAGISISENTRNEASNNTQQQVEQNTPLFRKNKIPDKLDEKFGKTLIYFERFDYYAKLYTQDAEEQIAGIKFIHQLLKHQNCTVMISLLNAEKLSAFDIKTDGSNTIFIGNPAAQEVRNTYLRMFLRSLPSDREIDLQLLRKLEEISQAIATSNKLLKQAISIFQKIVIDQHKTDINKHEFEIALENIVPEKVTLDDVVMDNDIRNEIVNAVDSFLNSNDTLSGRKGIILTGPPGTGKTHIIKAIANEKNCYFLAPTLADLKGEYIGQSSSKVRNVFSQARANSPTILFLDEADTIFPERDGGSDDKDSYTRDMVNQFLVEIDGLTSAKQKIFVIAATNRVNVIDHAILSRLTQVIEVPLPDKKLRIELFEKRLAKDNIRFKEKSFSDMIADRTDGMSGRDIDNFVKRLRESGNGQKLSRMTDEELENLFRHVLEMECCSLIDELTRDGVEVYSPENIEKNYKDIIGYEEEKNKINIQIREIIASQEEKQRCRHFGISPRKGILLYGPPGNGKTELVKAAAGEHSFYLVKVLSKNFSSALPQIQLAQIQNIFDKTFRLSNMLAHGTTGIILFFDEFDALADSHILSSIVRGTLLDYMTKDEMRSFDSRILFIAATNFYDMLDEALTRKGRIDTHICLNSPTEKNGVAILTRKIRSDNSIQQDAVSDIDISEAYQRLKTKIQETYLENSRKKLRGIYIGQVNELENELKEEASKQLPSIADILSYFEEMKINSFYAQHDKNLIHIQFN